MRKVYAYFVNSLWSLLVIHTVGNLDSLIVSLPPPETMIARLPLLALLPLVPLLLTKMKLMHVLMTCCSGEISRRDLVIWPPYRDLSSFWNAKRSLRFTLPRGRIWFWLMSPHSNWKKKESYLPVERCQIKERICTICCDASEYFQKKLGLPIVSESC